MEARLQDHKVVADHPIYESVFLVDAPRPHIAGPMFETLGLTAPVARITDSDRPVRNHFENLESELRMTILPADFGVETNLPEVALR